MMIIGGIQGVMQDKGELRRSEHKKYLGSLGPLVRIKDQIRDIKFSWLDSWFTRCSICTVCTTFCFSVFYFPLDSFINLVHYKIILIDRLY